MIGNGDVDYADYGADEDDDNGKGDMTTDGMSYHDDVIDGDGDDDDDNDEDEDNDE